ncbi:MAG: ParB family transcriptional regulator, chromosome partitioning protein [Acidobacteriota bacterium]|jgi:ParB/RepB/Spo0J family partition protein
MATVKPVVSGNTDIVQLPVKSIIPARFRQARSKKNRGPLDGLVASVRERGVLEPILVRPIENEAKYKGMYELVFGERRWLASQEAGRKEIPAMIKKLDDVEASLAQITENVQRENLHPIDEGDYYGRMVQVDPRLSDAEIARRVGKSHDYVTRCMSLNNLVNPVKEAFLAGDITLGHALAIARIGPETQLEALNKGCFESRWTPEGSKPDKTRPRSVRQLEEWIDRFSVMDLSKVPWDLKDETLGLGACMTCQYRTGTTPSLFPDVKDENLCTNRVGFMQKQRQYITRQADEARTKTGSEVLFVSTLQYLSDPKEHPPGTLTTGDYRIVEGKHKCEHAKTAIATDGEKFGRSIMVCASKKCKDHMGAVSVSSSSSSPSKKNKSTAEFRERRQELFNLRVAETTRQRILKEALAKVKWPLNRRWLNAVAVELLGRTPTKLVSIVNEVLGRGDDKELPDSFTGYQRDTSEALKMIGKMRDDEVAQLLMLLTLVPVGWNEYMARTVDQSEFVSISKELRIDYLLRDAETRVELCARKARAIHQTYLEQVREGKRPAVPSIYIDEAKPTLPVKKATKSKKPAKRAVRGVSKAASKKAKRLRK